MAEGSLDPWRATVIADELRDAGREVCAAVEDLVFPDIVADTAGQARGRVRRALHKVDADAVRAKAAKARLERCVSKWAHHIPGLTQWAATLPAADSARCWAAIDALAHQMHADDPGKTLDQARADALVDLILGQADVSTTVTFLIPVETLTDEPDLDLDDASTGDLAGGSDADWAVAVSEHAEVDNSDSEPRGNSGRRHLWPVDPEGHHPSADLDGPLLAGAGAVPPGELQHIPLGLGGLMLHPGVGNDPPGRPLLPGTPTWLRVAASGYEIPGVGIIPGDIVAQLTNAFDTSINRVLLDPRTGVVKETGTQPYRPSRRIRRMVQLRDSTCRFPGCTRAAARCEADHVVPYPHGPTAVHNLASLCKHHHRTKHESGWQLTMTPDGVCTWTSRTGQTYRTHPTNYYELIA